MRTQLRGLCLALFAVAALAVSGASPAAGRSAGVTYLDNGTIRLGVDLDDGGKITYLARSSGGAADVIHDVLQRRELLPVRRLLLTGRSVARQPIPDVRHRTAQRHPRLEDASTRRTVIGPGHDLRVEGPVVVRRRDHHAPRGGNVPAAVTVGLRNA